MSNPFNTSVTFVTSFTFLANIPTWSKLEAKGNNPNLLILPYVGLKPTVPVYDAGFLTESPVSLPILKGTIPRLTATALPQDEPPAILDVSQGFLVIPVCPVKPVPPIASSSIVFLPINTAPLSLSFL